MTQLVLVRHGEIEKKDDAGGVDRSEYWPLSADGVKQARAAGQYLLAENLVDPDHSEIVFGTQYRLRETLLEMGDLPAELRTYAEDYLNGRLRSAPAGRIEDPMLEKHGVADESFFQFVQRSAERLQLRVERRWEHVQNFIAITSRELIVALRFRLRGSPLGEKRSVLRGLAHDSAAPSGEFDVAPGEIVIVSDIDPHTRLQERRRSRGPAFRWEKVVNPLHPERNRDWKHFTVRTYRREELLDPKLWGDPPRADTNKG